MNKQIGVCMLLASLTAGAQDEPTDSDAPAESEARENAPLTPSDASQVKMSPTDTETSGQVHTVRKGDTLWDLSQTYMGSPWYWPKVWSYNPQIANPHWIYPGGQVRFMGAANGPARVEAGELDSGGSSDSSGELAMPMTSDSLTTEEEVRVERKISYVEKPGLALIRQGFVSEPEVKRSGIIRGSIAETLMLTTPDVVYLEFDQPDAVKVGGRYVVYRVTRRIDHPITKDSQGYATLFLGTAEVLERKAKWVKARLTDSWDEIRRGDLLGPVDEKMLTMTRPVPNDRALKGFIVGMIEPNVTLYGEQMVVLVDRGRADGVKPGNTFTVIRQNDPTKQSDFMKPSLEQNPDAPVEEIAGCIIVEVKEKNSTCLLTRTLREIVAGDRIEMHASAK